MNRLNILCFGELLWDVLPDGIFLGGAPANVAYHGTKLGANCALMSNVGRDFLGEESLRRLNRFGVDTSFISTSETSRTGTVQVVLDNVEAPEYEITHNAAWDCITFSADNADCFKSFNALVFGTLALRSAGNRQTLHRLITAVNSMIVFDVNFRWPFVDFEHTVSFCERAHLVKLNCDELTHLLKYLNKTQVHDLTPVNCESVIRDLAELWQCEGICVTFAEHGSVLLWHTQFTVVRMDPAKVVSSVGAGDAYLARLVIGLLRRQNVSALLDDCSRLAGYVVQMPGATPDYDPRKVGGLSL